MSQIKRTFSPEIYHITYSVNSVNHNSRLDQFLQIHFSSFSREKIKQKISAGDIKISGRDHRLKPSTKVKEREIVSITTYKKDMETEYWSGKPIVFEEDIEIIEETDKYIVINKPPFMSAHPTGKHLFYCATTYLDHLTKSKVATVHRLDRETSGLMILSKNPSFSQKMTTLFENKRITKAYLLIAHVNNGARELPFEANESLGTRDDFIPNLYTHCFPGSSTQGKKSQTRFIEIFRNSKFLVALAFPKTGRQHQIRAHSAHHGYPLLGDKLYNGDPQVFTRFKDGLGTEEDFKKMQIPRHALHAVALKIPDPVEKTFTAQLPQDLCQWIEQNLSIKSAEIDQKCQEIIKKTLA